MIAARRRGATTIACVVALAVLAGACGNNDTLEADEQPSQRAGRFPAAVVSTTTLVTTPFGQPVRVTTTTIRKTAAPGAATSTTTRGGGTAPAPRVRPDATPMPAPRTGLAGTDWQGFVIAAGGIDAAGDPSARVDSYEPASGKWQRGPDLPEAVHDGVLSVLGDDLYFIGGFTLEGDQSIVQAATYVFHAGDTSWHSGPNLNTPRGGPAAVTVGDTLVVFGGETTDGGSLDAVETLAAAGGDEWKDGPPLIHKRAFASAVASGGRVYAVGGRDGGVSTALESVESWKPGADNWRSELNLHDKRASAGAGANCVAGGESGDGTVGSIECLSDGKWTIKYRMSVPRHGLAAGVIDGWMHLVGGGPRPGPTVNSAHEIFDVT